MSQIKAKQLGFTNQGALIYGGANGGLELVAGSTNQVLTIVGGVPTWAAAQSGTPSLPNGEVFIGNGSNVATPTAPTAIGQTVTSLDGSTFTVSALGSQYVTFTSAAVDPLSSTFVGPALDELANRITSLPSGIHFAGNLNPSTQTLPSSPNNGDLYEIITSSGNFSGGLSYQVSPGDFIAWNGSSWVLFDNSESSVLAGPSGAISVSTSGPKNNNFTVDVTQINLATQTTGSLGVANGGTGLTTLTANGILYANSTSSFAEIPPTGTNTFLQWTGTAYQWSTAGTGTVTGGTSSGTGQAVFDSVDTTSTTLAFYALESTSSTITITAPDANKNISLDVDQANLSLGSIGGSLALGSQVTGTLAVVNGGTGLTTVAAGDLLYGSAANTLANLAIGTSGQVLSVVGGVPTWSNPSGTGTVTTATNEGTGVGIWDATDSTASTLAFYSLVPGSNLVTIANPVTGNIAIDVDQANLSIGASQITGVLGVPNGGTGATTLTAGALLVGAGTSTVTLTPVPTVNDTFLRWDTTNGFTWQAAGTGTVTSVELSSSGTITVAGTNPVTSSGTITVDVNQSALSLSAIGGSLNLASQVGTSVLPVANGGTGAATLTTNGVLIGNGTSAVTTVAAPTDSTYLFYTTVGGFSWSSITNPTPADSEVTASSTVANATFTGFFTAAPVANTVEVFFNGLKLRTTGYTISGTNLTLVDSVNGYGVDNGDVISAHYYH